MLRPLRIVLGMAAALHAIELWGWGFQSSHSGAFFVLPLVPGLDLVPGWLHAAAVLGLGVAGLAFAAGEWTAGVVAGALVLYFQLGDLFAFHDGDFLLAQSLVLAGLWTRADGRRDVRASRDFRLALCALAALVYFVAGLNKVNSEFLSGAVISAILPGSSPVRWMPGGCMLLAWGTAATELSLPVLLLFRRTRPLGVAVGLGMHAGILLMSWRGTVFHVYAPLGMLAFGLERRERVAVLVTLAGLWLWCAWGILPRML